MDRYEQRALGSAFLCIAFFIIAEVEEGKNNVLAWVAAGLGLIFLLIASALIFPRCEENEGPMEARILRHLERLGRTRNRLHALAAQNAGFQDPSRQTAVSLVILPIQPRGSVLGPSESADPGGHHGIFPPFPVSTATLSIATPSSAASTEYRPRHSL